MKNYTVKINTNRKLFSQKNMDTIGWVEAKSKKEAIQLVYEAFQGIDNKASLERPHILIDTRMSNWVGPSTKMVAEIETN